MVGRTISHYRVLRHVGAGGMGVVYEAEDLVLGRHVAVKFLSAARSRSPQVLQRFEREARAASALNHPHICTIHEFVEHEGERFMVMELLDGEPLRDRLARGALEAPDLVAIGTQIADALGAAHAVGVTHRDLTPSNIFITARGDAKILDFGLAKLTHPDAQLAGSEKTTETAEATLTTPGAMMGTVAYMSPEQIRGEEPDHRADLFSFGVVLYEAATGVRPFTGKTSAMIFDAILHADPLPARRLNPRLPEVFDHIVAKALEKDPGFRYQNAREVVSDLQRMRRAGDEGNRPARGARLFPGWAGAAMATVIVGLAGTLAYWLTATPERPPLAGTPRQITSGAGVETDPAISPDGSTIAYTSAEGGNDDIWIVDVSGGPPQQLTKSDATDRRPVWWPDGSAILFASDRGGRTGIWRAPRLDADAATLLVADADDPALSPDGTQLAFVTPTGEGYGRIGVAPLAALDRTRVLTDEGQGLWDHARPAWSPDGKTICYDSWDGLWTVPGSGGPARRLTTAEARSDFEPAWSADGRFIYFTSLRGARMALWRVPSAGGAAERVTAGSGTERMPALSPRGGLLAYSTSSSTLDLRLTDLSTGTHRDFGTTRDELFPTFAPDGRTIYFVSDRWGNIDIWKQAVSATGPDGPPARIVDEAGVESHTECSPDGRWIAYYRILGPRRDIMIAPTSGGRPRQLTDDASGAIHPSWSHDGRRIAFVSERDGTRQIRIQQVVEGRADGPARRLTSDGGGHHWPAWSSDDSKIAYVAGSGEIALVDVHRGGAPVVITQGAKAVKVRAHPDSGLLLVAGQWGGAEFELRALHHDGRPATVPRLPIALGAGAPAFDISADGRLLIATHKAPSGDIWTIELK